MTVEITDDKFEQEVTNSKDVVLVDFWAEWCGPCKMLSPIVDQLSEELKDTVKVMKMDIDANPESPSKLGVRGLPTLMIFKDGKPIATKLGAHPKGVLVEWINESLK